MRQGELAGLADDDVEPERQHHEDEEQVADIDDVAGASAGSATPSPTRRTATAARVRALIPSSPGDGRRTDPAA